MPNAVLNGTSYAYDEVGSGPLIVFGHGLLASRAMFRAQMEALGDRYRCVSIDWPLPRPSGSSPASPHGDSGFRDGGWTLYDMVDDTTALVKELGEERAVFAGLSQGGMVFMRLAALHPELVRALILLDTSAGPENPETIDGYRQLAAGMRDGSDEQRAEIVPVVQSILYGQTWLNANPDGAAHERDLMLGHDRQGLYLACQAVFDRDDVSDRLGEIRAPTLVICGEEDVATPPDLSAALAEGIAGAELVMIPRAGHDSSLENPAPVTEAIERFLAP
jgi:pimeloyl-ACP methyl ester carboxylesterase